MPDTNPNADVIEGLRQAAMLLERNPELPRVYYASVNIRSEYTPNGTDARATLTALAAALGELAEEKAIGEQVLIEGRLTGNVCIHASAKRRELTDTAPVEPDYEPIIAVREERESSNPGLVRPF